MQRCRPTDIVDMLLHGVLKSLDLACLPAGDKGSEIVRDHGPDCAASAASGVGIAGAFGSVVERNRCVNSSKWTVISVHGVGQHFAQGDRKISG
jgi:hypothetical protein